jgi:hypothetical protein
MADAMAQSIPVTSDAIKGTIKGFEDVGVDELILWPCTAELGQVDRLADAVG